MPPVKRKVEVEAPKPELPKTMSELQEENRLWWKLRDENRAGLTPDKIAPGTEQALREMECNLELNRIDMAMRAIKAAGALG